MTRAITPGRPVKVGLAVSGGGDSVAMLHLFAACAAAQNYVLSVATVDHGLRPEAAEEAAFVAGLCADLGVPHEILRWKDWNGKGNLQAAARNARYLLLGDWGARMGVDAIALGHTHDDLAETFLMRLARGSGLDGLAAMERSFTRNGMAYIRPLLSLERDKLRRYLTRHGHAWRDDPSNKDTQFLRVRARRALQALAPLGITAHEVSSAALDLQMAKSALAHVVRDCAEEIVQFEGGDLVMSWLGLAVKHTEVKRRLMNEILTWVGGSDYPPRADALFEMILKTEGYKPHTLNGCFVTSSKDALRVAREYNAVKDLVCTTDALWDGRWSFEGPHAADLQLRALGPEGMLDCPDWRETGLPRASLLASPAVWRGADLVAAPAAGLANGWCATLTRSREQFLSGLLSH